MALTKIQRNMIANGAVMPNNLVTTATYTVGALTSNGAITGTNIVASGTVTAPTQVTTPKISVSGSNGFAVDTLRVNTGSWITYYNPTSKEITYGPITGTTGTLAVYDQSLNTTDRVRFASVTATTNLTVGGTIAMGSTLTLGLSVIKSDGNFSITGIGAGVQNFGLVYNPSNGTVTYVPLPGQNLASTGSVTFANLTITNTATILDATVSRRLTANTATITDIVLTRKLTTTNASGLIVEGIRSSTSTFAAYYNTSTKEVTYGPAAQIFDQNLNTTNSPTFNNLSLDGDLTFNGGGTIYNDTGVIRSLRLKTSIIEGPAPDSAVLFIPGTGTSSEPYPESAVFTEYMRGSTATFNTLYVSTGSQQNYTGGIRGGSPGAGGDLFLFAGSLGYNGVIRLNASYIEPACSIIPRQNLNVNLGSSTNRWNRGWIKTLTVGTSTIYFEDDNGENTSTFSIDAGTVSIDSIPVLDQSVAVGSSPTFSSIDATTSTFTDIVVNSELFFSDNTVQTTAWTGTYSYNNLTDKPYIPNQSVDTTSSPTFQNLTVLGTMTTLNVTTENVTQENVVTQAFADGTTQTTAWTGTVASSQITSVSTSKVAGLSVVGYTGNWIDLIGAPPAPNQLLDNTSSVQFANLTVGGGSPTTNGTLINTSNVWLPNIALNTQSNVLNFDTVTGQVRYQPLAYDQNLFTTSSPTFSGVSINTGTRVTRTVSAGGFPLNSAGTATVSTNLANYPALMVSNFTSNITPNIGIRAYGQSRPNGTATTAPNPTIFIEGSRGTAASPTAVQANDALGGMAVQGFDGLNWPGDQNPNSYNYLGFYATEAMTNNGSTATYQAGAGFNMFLQPGWTRPGLGATRQRIMFTSWTTSSTGPSILNYLIGSGVDATAPTMTMVDGTTYTGYGRTNFTQVNTIPQIIGVPSQDTAPDNVTLTGTNVINFISNRRSGASTRRNAIQTGDDLGALNFRGQHVPNSTGVGLRGAQVFSRALEAFTSTRAGSAIGINTVNSGTVVESSRLYLTDRENIHGSDSHVFRDKSNSFTALTMTTSSVAFNTGAAITTYNRTYAEFCYTGTTITATATNSIYAFPLNTVNTANGIVIQNSQQIKFNQVGGGAFKIIMSLQTSMTTNSIGSMEFWLRKNGVDVPNSATQVDLLKDQKAVIAMDWLVTPAANDYYEIVYVVDDTALDFPYYAPLTSPYVRPAVPPIIVNVIPVGA